MASTGILSILRGAMRDDPPQADDLVAPAMTGKVRLRTLVLLRWLAVAGQTAAVLVVGLWLQFDMPLGTVLGVIATSAWVNIFFMLSRPNLGPISDWEATGHLAYDVVQLAVLLGLTGGIANPFVMLFIGPVAVSTIVLRPPFAVGLAVFAFICVGVIAFWRMPLPWIPGEPYSPPLFYQIGMGAAVLTGLVFTGAYAWRVAAEEERLNEALSAVQMVLAREQKLSALGGLAAAAAHELGTPLATIHLVAKELQRQAPADSPLLEDLQLLVSQSERCRAILKQLTARKEDGDALLSRVALRELLPEVADRYHGLGPDIVISAEGRDGSAEPVLRRLPELLHGLGNLVENAVGFAENRVEFAAAWTADELRIVVSDDGPGFPPSVVGRLGEPYVSERAQEGGGGLGLGFFIAKTLLERTGGRLDAHNKTEPETGAVVRIVWPRRAIEAAPL